MDVFIIWSGSRSEIVAKALKDWLRNILHRLDPWISTDIPRGKNWRTELAQTLRDTRVAIVCLTPENVSNSWVNFEAAAIWKADDNNLACTYLLDLVPDDIAKSPLSIFNCTVADKQNTRELVHSLNNDLGNHRRESAQLEKDFEEKWPKLEKSLNRAKGIDLEVGGVDLDQQAILYPDFARLTNQLARELEAKFMPTMILASAGPSVIAAVMLTFKLGESIPVYIMQQHPQGTVLPFDEKGSRDRTRRSGERLFRKPSWTFATKVVNAC